MAISLSSTVYATFAKNYLDGIPFRLGPQFIPPSNVLLPPGLELKTSEALNQEYGFEVEEAVLKWSAEREQEAIYGNLNGNYSDYEDLATFYAKRAVTIKENNHDDVYANIPVPNTLLSQISNDVLKPTPSGCTKKDISTSASDNVKTDGVKMKSKSRDLDLTLLEQEDNQYDNLEQQTGNVMQELTSVLKEKMKLSPDSHDKQATATSRWPDKQMISTTVTKEENIYSYASENENHDTRSESPVYENFDLGIVDLKSSSSNNTSSSNTSDTCDPSKVPLILPRRNLVERFAPLPSIGKNSAGIGLIDSNSKSSDFNLHKSLDQAKNSLWSTTDPKNGNSVKSNLVKDPCIGKYSHHQSEVDEDIYSTIEPSHCTNTKSVESKFKLLFKNAKSSPNLKNNSKSKEESNVKQPYLTESCSSANVPKLKEKQPVPAPRRPHLPPRPASLDQPPRPASLASQNSISPLPRSPLKPCAYDLPDGPDVAQQTSYTKLTEQARAAVDHVAMMGFTKDRVIQAVGKLGPDEKEVVEYLCFVDQLVEKGYSVSLAEDTLHLFQNSMHKALKYLEMFVQMRELGFPANKIKEALIKTNNDREKTLDILTASM